MIKKRFLVNTSFDPNIHPNRYVVIWESCLPDTGLWSVKARRLAYSDKAFEHMLILNNPSVEDSDITVDITERDYRRITKLAKAAVCETRYYVTTGDHQWTVYMHPTGEASVTTIAEITVENDYTAFTLPTWVGQQIKPTMTLTA